jgi:hypothetical protein
MLETWRRCRRSSRTPTARTRRTGWRPDSHRHDS